MAKRIITEADINKVVESGKQVLECQPGNCIVTPQARDKADLLGVEILMKENQAVSAPQQKVEAQPEVAAATQPAAPVANSAQSETDVLIAEVCGIIKGRLGGAVSEEALAGIVRRVVTEKLSATDSPADAAGNEECCPGGVCVIEGQRLVQQGDSPIPVDEQVFIADALGECAGAELAAGYMEWTNASFNRTVESAEVAVVVSGDLQLTMAGKTVSAKAGDMVYLPEGVEVLYATTSSVRLACINNVA